MARVKTARILVVEDDPHLLAVIRLILESAGYLVDEAINGRQALEYLSSAHPDAAVVDMRMPIVSGDELAAHIRSDPSTAELPILLLSGLDVPDPKRFSADAALKKPFDAKELMRVVGELVASGTTPH